MRECPDCGRELDKWQHFCSECAQVRRDITNIICGHNYEQKPERIKSKAEYRVKYRAEHLEEHKAYMKRYHQKRKST